MKNPEMDGSELIVFVFVNEHDAMVNYAIFSPQEFQKQPVAIREILNKREMVAETIPDFRSESYQREADFNEANAKFTRIEAEKGFSKTVTATFGRLQESNGKLIRCEGKLEESSFTISTAAHREFRKSHEFDFTIGDPVIIRCHVVRVLS